MEVLRVWDNSTEIAMMQLVILSFFAFWIALLPIYLWGYGVTMLSWDTWNRRRFWLGAISWVVSVWLVYLIGMFHIESWMLLLGIAGVIGILYSWVVILTHFWSSFSRVFLRKITVIHGILLFILAGLAILISHSLGTSYVVPILFTSILISAYFEEVVKHFSSLALMGKDFRFSKRDVVLFTFFVAIGFVFVENILYFIRWDLSISQWIFRSFFTLVLHVFSAVFCSYYWWKALSYSFFSWKYMITFVVWFLGANAIHVLYNYSLENSNIIVVLIITTIGYLFLSRMLIEEKN